MPCDFSLHFPQSFFSYEVRGHHVYLKVRIQNKRENAMYAATWNDLIGISLDCKKDVQVFYSIETFGVLKSSGKRCQMCLFSHVHWIMITTFVQHLLLSRVWQDLST